MSQGLYGSSRAMAIDTALKTKSVLLCVVRRLTVSGDEFLASIVVFFKTKYRS
jgi:hypothetical protein